MLTWVRISKEVLGCLFGIDSGSQYTIVVSDDFFTTHLTFVFVFVTLGCLGSLLRVVLFLRLVLHIIIVHCKFSILIITFSFLSCLSLSLDLCISFLGWQ